MRIVFLILLLSSNCFGAEIKATGKVFATIVEAENVDITNPAEIVFTENGATE